VIEVILLKSCEQVGCGCSLSYRSFDAQLLAGTGIPELLEKTIGVLEMENNLA